MPITASIAPKPAPSADRYGGVARLLHWAIVLLVVVQLATKAVPVGWLGVFSEERLNAWHLGVGPMILVIMLVRLGWRLTHAPPPPPRDLPLGLQLLSRATHWAFYALLVLIPVIGWAAASGYGAAATLLGIVPLPAIAAKNDRLAETLGALHGTLAWVLLAVIALHVAGALYHGVVKRDGVLGRMLP